MIGQFGKPPSRPTERVGDLELPVYRGHMVPPPNCAAPTPSGCRPATWPPAR
ncbi:hypothetical protein [Streptomyces sp. NPDC005538]